ncbi:hypothetical protein GK047_09230 [Paenibacillus sp. SYP-B3998]|uniref:Uncharacterized protein n=1 Tax=Paenibacillus sp. SYP-B3998 TaxID=2678564 RepID=A0A6G3ZVN2_9BACL|nr:hypothetical protein [Paenibacillus sp. SYP-B3998]NEW06192.1 hypothetical protein [Paenibacillus sp. SYP-B3998]
MTEKKSERKFHFLGVLLGVCVDNLGTFVTSALIGSAYFATSEVSQNDLSQIYSNIGLLLLLMVVGLFWSFFGGFVAAKVAKRAEYFNASIIGVIGAAIGFDSMLTNRDVPLWYELTGFIVIVPVSLLGGYLALKRKKKVSK